MEFWGVEVKPGKAVKVDPREVFRGYIHISQVALDEPAKKDKGNEPAVLYMKVGEQKLVLGTLNRDDLPQLSLDLVLDKEFELSHSSKNASVYFCGYKVDDDSENGPFGSSEDFSESDEDVALTGQDNGKPDIKPEKEKVTEAKKAIAGSSAKLVKIADPKKDEEGDSDDDDEDDESDDEDEFRSPVEMDADSNSDEESESDEDEDDEETPVKKLMVDQGKKRPNESASKTPLAAKKAKNATPENTDGKKNAHTATPHPMKKGGKTPNSVTKDQTPNSGGQLSCKSCNKAFNSESGLQQHKKAKHGGQ